MAFPRPHHKAKPKPRSQLLFLFLALAAIAVLFLLSSLTSTNGASSLSSSHSIQKIFRFNTLNQNHKRKPNRHVFSENDKFLYWGNRIDCPGKHCDSCEGLGHQESSLRCALEEAMFLQRYIYGRTYSEFLGFNTCLGMFYTPTIDMIRFLYETDLDSVKQSSSSVLLWF